MVLVASTGLGFGFGGMAHMRLFIVERAGAVCGSAFSEAGKDRRRVEDAWVQVDSSRRNGLFGAEPFSSSWEGLGSTMESYPVSE